MSIIVRITIEDQGIVGGTKDNKVLFVFFVAKQPAKKTAAFLNGARAQVRLAPRSPQPIHLFFCAHNLLIAA